MAEAIVSDLAVKVLELLSKSAAQKIAPYFGGQKKLSELQRTMEMIEARLYDAEKRQEAEQGKLIKVWLNQLKDVMYRLEDLLEEFAIEDEENEQEEIDSKMPSSSKLSKMVCCFPSVLSSLKLNKVLSDEADSIMKELDSITTNMERFKFSDHSLNHQERGQLILRTMKEETHSFVREELVIGRDEEKREILDMLYDCDEGGENFCVVSIVGMGGLGKTTLAQLVFNGIQVGHQQQFDLKSWVCISDQICSLKELAGKVLHSITGVKVQCSSVEELQLKLRQAVKDKRFLLVFDDVWDEDYGKWVQLKNLLLECKLGSKILVTTRSEGVARNMGVVKPYKLSGLSEEKSWELFKSIALNGRKEKANPNLISVGREIVAKCANVPLAICTIAGHLYSRDTEEYWMHLLDKEFRMIDEAQDRIMQILKISYDHLRSHQKQCFAYCSLFPKDYSFEVRSLIQLWMAQGFVQSLVDGHICFMELLRTSFFQNLQSNAHNMETCQMHDLMHDLAQLVGNECLLLDGSQKDVSGNIRHVHIVDSSCLRSKPLRASIHMRSYLDDLYNASGVDVNPIISSFTQLRVLALHCENLPRSIGQLKHLRYLKACVNSEYLPGEITKLRFLQTLDLSGSKRLIELPKEFHRLSSLKNLQMEGVYLKGMPPRFRELESLQSLDTFVAGANTGLDALARMNLVGNLRINFKKRRRNEVAEAMKANLKGKQLTDLRLHFYDEQSFTEADELLESLQPPPNLKHLTVHQWKGIRLPKWMDLGEDSADFSVQAYLRSLESLYLLRLLELKTLPSGIFQITTIQGLYLSFLNIEILPESIGNLTQLRRLTIGHCRCMHALPKSIQNLTALERFRVIGCGMLTERCAQPDGVDWPLIQHIPDVIISKFN